MQLRESALIILNQIKLVVERLKPEEYSASLDLLSGNSIGKHIRHVLEFFDLLTNVNQKSSINYDKRQHDIQLESNKDLCLIKINDIISALKNLTEDRQIKLEVSYTTDIDKPVAVETSINRELAYNIEHAIHHMAILKIAIITLFPSVDLPKDFGVAYSTIRYQKTENN